MSLFGIIYTLLLLMFKDKFGELPLSDIVSDILIVLEILIVPLLAILYMFKKWLRGEVTDALPENGTIAILLSSFMCGVVLT
jgi:hypothetical protein